MNVLTFRNIRSLAVSGDIKINDRVVNRDQMNDISAYLQQDDLFLGTLTVREHLLFKVQCFIKINLFFGDFCAYLSITLKPHSAGFLGVVWGVFRFFLRHTFSIL